MQFTVHKAKTQLSKLIEAALRGEEVVIARGSKPVVRLVPMAQTGFQLGTMKDTLGEGPDFLDGLTEDELELWEGG